VDDCPLADVVDDDANRELSAVIDEVGQHEARLLESRGT
jgi:hypothetical protein